jgi:hypothetical protein
MCIVYIQLPEACFGHHNVFKSSNEKLILTRLKQKPKNHQNHATLRLKFFSNNHNLCIVKIFSHAYKFVNYLSKCSHLALLSDVFERFYLIWPNCTNRCYCTIIGRWLLIVFRIVYQIWRLRSHHLGLLIFLLKIKLPPRIVLHELLQPGIALILHPRGVIVIYHEYY